VSDKSEPRSGIGSLVDEYRRAGLSRREFVRRAALLGVSAPAAASLLAAAAPRLVAAQGTPQTGGTFIEGYDRDFTKMDPVQSGWADPGYNALYEYTMIRDPNDGHPVAALAESWTVSDDKLTWTFKIRDGLKFHTGAPCTNANVVEDFNIFRDSKTGQNAIFWASVTDVSAGDGNTVVVKCSKPFAAFPETLATEYSMIHNEATRKAVGDSYGATKADGTGPFTLTEFTPGKQVLMNRWDGYPGTNIAFVENKGKAYVDQLRWVPIIDAASRANEIEAGTVHAIRNPGGQDVDRLKANPDLVVMEWPNPANVFLALNCANADLGFTDVRVRQAISQAIDREGIVNAVYFGHAAATYGPIASNWKWYEPGVEKFNKFDPANAKKLLDAAGWTVGSDGIREKNGKKLSWTNANLGDQPFNRPIMEAVVGMLKDVGVDMKSNDLGIADFVKARGATPPPDSFSQEWLWSSPMDVLVIFGKAIPSLAYNGNIADLNAAFDAWQGAGTDDELKAAASKAQLVWAEQLPKIPIVTANGIFVNSKKAHGWKPSQTMLYPLYNDVWVEK
jgi:peptide/nickel transport system substrate-binding protein